MRDRFVNTLIDIAKKDKNVHLVTGDLGFGVLKPFYEALPEQFINVGIAEQNMTSFAAGLALTGKTVFTYSIGNFPTLRCLEQIRNDCAYHNANVKIVCVGGGFVYGSLGMSHHATEDLGIMRSLPNVTVLSPGDLIETEYATRAIYNHYGTCYLRLGRGGEARIHDTIENFTIGRAIKIQQGKRLAIFSTGSIFDEVKEVDIKLKEQGIHATIYTFPTVKPIDRETIISCMLEHELIITVEEHTVIGGFGSAISEVLATIEEGKGTAKKAHLMMIGIPDLYSSIVGSSKYLRDQYGISANKIYNKIMEELKKKVL